MSRNRGGAPCPKCAGQGQLDEFAIGLIVVCTQCDGTGVKPQPPDKLTEPADPPVWAHPAVAAFPACRVCFGSGTIVNLGGAGEPIGQVIEMPCPACGQDAAGSGR